MIRIMHWGALGLAGVSLVVGIAGWVHHLAAWQLGIDAIGVLAWIYIAGVIAE